MIAALTRDVRKPVEGPIFPPPRQWFGDSFVLFTNTPEFLSRVVKAATTQGLKTEGRPVEYYDATSHSGKTGRFRKQAAYAHQSEYRIAIEPGVEEARLFDIGDLSDITSEVIPIANADEVLKFSPEDARDARSFGAD